MKFLLRWTIRFGLVAAVVGAAFSPYDYEISGRCRLKPRAEYGARAQLADEVITVSVTEGEWVEAGTEIATLSGRDVNADYLFTRAELKEAQANLDLLNAGARGEDIAIAEERLALREVQYEFLHAELERVEQAYTREAATIQELDKARQNRDSSYQMVLTAKEYLDRIVAGARPEEIRAAAAEVERLQSRLAYHDEQRGLVHITTPIAGRVVTTGLEKKVGQVAQKGELIAIIQDDSVLVVEIAADEAAATVVLPGMPVTVRLDGFYGEPLAATVERVSNHVITDAEFDSSAVRSDRELQIEQNLDNRDEVPRVRVYARLNQRADGMIPGMTGFARIDIAEGRLWQALVRPVARYLRTDVWSWLP